MALSSAFHETVGIGEASIRQACDRVRAESCSRSSGAVERYEDPYNVPVEGALQLIEHVRRDVPQMASESIFWDGLTRSPGNG